jgi:hypothetical protein
LPRIYLLETSLLAHQMEILKCHQLKVKAKDKDFTHPSLKWEITLSSILLLIIKQTQKRHQ